MKRFVQFLLILTFLNSLYAVEISDTEINNAILCMKDLVLVSCNYFISNETPENSKLKLRKPKYEEYPDAIVFEYCDFNELIDSFENKEIDSSNVKEIFKQPLYFNVRESLVANSWKENEAFAFGAVALAFKNNFSTSEIIDKIICDDLFKINVVSDMTLFGDLFPKDLNVTGVFSLEKKCGSLDVFPIQMMINNQEIDIFSSCT